MRWGNAGVTRLNHIMDTVTKNFLTFEQIGKESFYPSYFEIGIELL
jgi:hypothetical protein